MREVAISMVETSAEQSTPGFEKLFKKLVPSQGKCKTVEGELIRATAKVGYRWYNDGDKFFEGYGCETCGPAATYLFKSSVPDIKKLITAARSAKDYSSAFTKIIKAVEAYVLSKNGEYTKNTIDSLDTPSRWVQEENNDDEDNRW